MSPNGEEEQVEVVDEYDRVLYTTSLAECKSLGLIHRTVCVFVRNSDGLILLQQRSLLDDWLPGRWTVSCSGHIKAGENPEEASVRELEEELGIVAKPKFLFKELLPKITWETSIEHEIAYAFETESLGEPRINPNEVEKVQYVSQSDFSTHARSSPDDFTPDAIILLQKYLHEAGSGKQSTMSATNNFMNTFRSTTVR